MTWTNGESNGVIHELANAMWNGISYPAFDNLSAVKNILSINSYKEIVDMYRANRLELTMFRMNPICASVSNFLGNGHYQMDHYYDFTIS